MGEPEYTLVEIVGYEVVEARIPESKDSWSVNFVGANIDSYSEGMKLGFCENNISNYTANKIGTESLYRSISKTICGYRQSGIISDDWKDEIK